MTITKPHPATLARLLGAPLLILTMAGAATAQDPLGSPAATDTVRVDVVLDEMQAQLERLLPAMRRLALTLQDGLPEVGAGGTSRPDVEAIARRAARFTRAYFDALLAEGFTRDEALRIVGGGDHPGRR